MIVFDSIDLLDENWFVSIIFPPHSILERCQSGNEVDYVSQAKGPSVFVSTTSSLPPIMKSNVWKIQTVNLGNSLVLRFQFLFLLSHFTILHLHGWAECFIMIAWFLGSCLHPVEVIISLLLSQANLIKKSSWLVLFI